MRRRRARWPSVAATVAHAAPATPAPARPAGRRRLRRADQAEGPVAAAADDGRRRCTSPATRRSALILRDRASAATCRPAAPGAVNHWYDRDIDARMARTADRPVPSGRVAPRAALCVRHRPGGAVVRCWLSRPSTSLAAVAGAVGLPRLHARLHGLAQAPHAAEHRHRRRRGRRAAARRLGRGHRRAHGHGRSTCSRSSSSGRRRTSGRCRC